MDIKIIFSAISTACVVVAYIPYIRDIFSLKTQPHIYTWLIWAVTTGTATVGIWYGGGKWGALSSLVTFFLIFMVLLFSIKHGTKNIAKIDTIILLAAFGAIFVWWKLEQPLLAVIMVTGIDILGYLPTYRKSWEEPWSETLLSWFLFTLYALFGIFALNQYNIFTSMYLIAVFAANVILFFFCYLRRKLIPRSLS